jgi:hypothetical protein
MFQSKNPKNGVWNKPKASTYADFMVMYLDEVGHVQQDSLVNYSSPQNFSVFKEKFYNQLSTPQRSVVDILEAFSRKYSPLSWGEFDERNKQSS